MYCLEDDDRVMTPCARGNQQRMRLQESSDFEMLSAPAKSSPVSVTLPAAGRAPQSDGRKRTSTNSPGVRSNAGTPAMTTGRP